MSKQLAEDIPINSNVNLTAYFTDAILLPSSRTACYEYVLYAAD